MNCDKCGKSNSAQAKFCGKCGFTLKALVAEDQSLVAQESAELKSEPVQAMESESKLTKESTRQEETVGAAVGEQSYARSSASSDTVESSSASHKASPFNTGREDMQDPPPPTSSPAPSLPTPAVQMALVNTNESKMNLGDGISKCH